MKVRDIQFVNYFLLHETPFFDDLNKDITILDGEPDSITIRDNSITYCSPTSITMFLFNVLYNILSEKVFDKTLKDKLGLGLLQICHDYVYREDNTCHYPPVLIDTDKITIPSSIIHDILEPLVGKINMCNALYSSCNFTDTARIIESSGQMHGEYKNYQIARDKFPVILVNYDINNKPAVMSHLFYKIVEASFGKEKCNRIINEMFLSNSGEFLSHLITVLKLLDGEPEFIIDFLDYLESNSGLYKTHSDEIAEIEFNIFASDKYLSKYIKTADQTGQSIQINKQWSQWSMLMGLIEKQLEPMRGSMWPASENIKPHEDKLRAAIIEKSQSRNKNQANFEEMLECARDMYNHNSVEPGKLVEVLLKENRVWKQ